MFDVGGAGIPAMTVTAPGIQAPDGADTAAADAATDAETFNLITER
jgi:hypothetical protein